MTSKSLWILVGIIVVLAIAVAGLLYYVGTRPAANRGLTPLVEITPMEPDSAEWGVNYPNQYSTLQKTLTNNERTAYGGSSKISKLGEDPRLLTLFAGYGFSKEYNEDRGHLNSLEDVRTIKRVNETTPGTC